MKYLNNEIHNKEKLTKDDIINITFLPLMSSRESRSIMYPIRWTIQAANGTLTTQDRKNIQIEVDQLTSGINKIGTDTEFNTIKLLDPDGNDKANSGFKLQVGASAGQIMELPVPDMRSNAINISGKAGAEVKSKDGSVTGKFSTTKCSDAPGYALDVTTPENASDAIKIYDDAINTVSSSRSSLGAMQNALEYRIDYLDNTAENLEAAESRITDADMAKEMMEYTKESILYQCCQAMFIQANHKQESIIELLKSL